MGTDRNMPASKWADDDTDSPRGLAGEVMTRIESGSSDANEYIKVETQISTNAEDQPVKIERRIKVTKHIVRTKACVKHRRLRWKKFGDAAGAPAGPEPGVTSLMDEVDLMMVDQEAESEEKPTNMPLPRPRKVVASAAKWVPKFKPRETEELEEMQPMKSGSYRPPHMRFSQEEKHSLRVLNLPDDIANNHQLQDFFRDCGVRSIILRCSIIWDRRTRQPRKAYVDFGSYEDAVEARDKVNKQ